MCKTISIGKEVESFLVKDMYKGFYLVRTCDLCFQAFLAEQILVAPRFWHMLNSHRCQGLKEVDSTCAGTRQKLDYHQIPFDPGPRDPSSFGLENYPETSVT